MVCSITWEARSLVSVDALVDQYEVAVRARVEELREQAARVAVELAAAERALEHVSITRATLAVVLGERGREAGSAAKADVSGAQARGPARGIGRPATVPVHRPDLAEADLPGEYRRVYLAVRDAARGVRAGELARTLGLEPVPAKVEGLRYKLKRLASHGWILERAPGVFATG
jgi:hypothetical protein